MKPIFPVGLFEMMVIIS